jgi:hypothetical protein
MRPSEKKDGLNTARQDLRAASARQLLKRRLLSGSAWAFGSADSQKPISPPWAKEIPPARKTGGGVMEICFFT